MEQKNPGLACCILLPAIGLYIYCIHLGITYPTDGGCTSLDNGDLPKQSDLDFGWWFEVYGAIGLTFMILFCCMISIAIQSAAPEPAGKQFS